MKKSPTVQWNHIPPFYDRNSELIFFVFISSDKIDLWKIKTSILRTFELTIFRPFNLRITELSEYRAVTAYIILLTLIKGRPINI